MDLHRHLLALEQSLLDPAIRANSAAVDDLLADDFREFGSSGRTYTKLEILAALASEAPHTVTPNDFACQLLTPEVVLVTYRNQSNGSEALRSSLWSTATNAGGCSFIRAQSLPTPLKQRRYPERVSPLALSLLWPLPADASAHGPALDLHLFRNLWIALGLFALAHLLLLVGLLRSRRSAVAEASVWKLEYLPLAALSLLFIFLALQAERLWAAARYTGANPADLQIEATGMQFAWYFRYPGLDAAFGATEPRLVSAAEGNPVGLDPADPHGRDDLVTSELVLPQGREVDLRLHAQDVIHGFAVPELRLKQNAVPGQTIHIHFTATTPGTYAILCTQLCGLGHYRMNANLRVLPPTDFARWLTTKEAATP